MASSAPLDGTQIKVLQTLCSALASDRKLLRWFRSLAGLPANLRMNAIIQLTNEMRREEEEPELIGAVCRLSDGEVCAALEKALEEIL